jgi:SAM-dependent methyltransferase
VNERRLGEIRDLVLRDVGGALVSALAYLGDRLGLFRTLANAGPQTADELAARTRLDARWTREWARAMAAAELILHDERTDRFLLSAEQAEVLAREDSPHFLGGALHFAWPTTAALPAIRRAFENGGGVSWEDLGEEIPEAIERLFAPAYDHQLVAHWLPRIDGLVARLQAGIRVADVGCGAGRSTLAIARAFPPSHVVAIDVDLRLLERKAIPPNVVLRTGEAHTQLEPQSFDLICSFNAIHDMADPGRALGAIRAALRPGGVFLWGEPAASPRPMRNRHPTGRALAAIGFLHCVPVSLARNGPALGTLMGEDNARALAHDAGFTNFENLTHMGEALLQMFVLR